MTNFATVDYDLGDAVASNGDMAVHEEVGDSEFDYVLVGSNADSGGDDLVAFGFHGKEGYEIEDMLVDGGIVDR